MKDMIGELLRANMLQQLGDDQARVERLRKASGALADRFTSQDRGRLPSALLTAIDSNSSADAAMLSMTYEALLQVWETLGNAFPDTPMELCRAVLLDAAAVAFTGDDHAAAAGWYTLRTATEQLQVGRWEPVLRRMLKDWDDKVGPIAEQTWATELLPTDRAKEVPSSESAPIKVESAATTRAANIVSNSGGNWQTQAQLLTQQLRDLVNELVDSSNNAAMEALRLSEERTEALLAATIGEARGGVEAPFRAAQAADRRTGLLWWRSTSYSSRRRCRYTELTPEQATVAAALDVHHLADPLSPLSVEHVLNDTIAAAVKGEVTLTTLADCEWASELACEIEPAEGTILHAVVRDCDTPLVPRDVHIPPARAAVLLFRDLQAARLLALEISS